MYNIQFLVLKIVKMEWPKAITWNFTFATTSAVILFIFVLLAAVQHENGDNRSNLIMKFDDEVDRYDIHRINALRDDPIFYTGNCSTQTRDRDTDHDGTSDCEDVFPLWKDVIKTLESGQPDCSNICATDKTHKTHGTESNTSHKSFTCPQHMTEWQTLCNTESWSSSVIDLDDHGIAAMTYYKHKDSRTAEEETHDAECMAIYSLATDMGFDCNGDQSHGNDKHCRDANGDFTTEGLICTKMQCCAMQNGQKADSSNAFACADYDTASECETGFNPILDSLYRNNRTDGETVQFRAETTMSLTDFCSYTDSPASSNPTKHCVKIGDALNLWGETKANEDKDYKNMNWNLDHNAPHQHKNAFAIWWNAQWVLLGMAIIHFFLSAFGFGRQGNFVLFSGGNNKIWAVVHFIIVASILTVSILVFVTFIMFMSGKNEDYGTDGSQQRLTLSAAHNISFGSTQRSYEYFEFFNMNNGATCPRTDDITNDKCTILSNVQHHVFANVSDRIQTWTLLLGVAYACQIIAAGLYFVHLCPEFWSVARQQAISNPYFDAASQIASTVRSKIGTSTTSSAPAASATPDQKRVVSAYANSKVRNGSMKF